VGAQSYECTSSAHQQRRSGKIGRPGGTTVLKAYAAIKRREKQPGIYHDKVKDFAISLSGKALTASLAVGSGLIQIEMNNKENDASK
jgi:hypothetical protein